MKAALIREHGGIGAVNVEDHPDPRPGAGEAVLEVRAAALNHLDLWVLRGGRSTGMPMPHVPGSDASGVISELGPGAQGFEIGQEVVLNPGFSCGRCEYCRRGEQSECAGFGIVGMSRPGTFAGRVAVPVGCLLPKPAHLGFEEAACLGIAYITAWRMLVSKARAVPGETALIHGIGGGVALAALQFCERLGVRAVVTSSSDEKLRRASEFGAAAGVNYRREPDVAAAVRRRLGGRGADLSINSVGAPALAVDMAALRRGGRAVLCGVTAGAEGNIDLQPFYWNQLSLLGSTLGSAEDARQMMRAADSFRLRPVVDSVHPLAEVRGALERMERGEQFGKIVLKVDA